MTLAIKDVWKSYGKVSLLNGVSLEVAKGEAVAILGRSGEGKTTLLHILGGLEAPDKGSVSLGPDPLSLSSYSLRNRQIGFVFQSFHLLEDLTALENVLLPSQIARKPLSTAEGLTLLSRVGLTPQALTLAKALSGGEKQRVAIARALCNQPHFLLADEPTGNLDRFHAKQIRELLLSCVRESKAGLILVTHDEDLAALCDRRLHLKEGQLIGL